MKLNQLRPTLIYLVPFILIACGSGNQLVTPNNTFDPGPQWGQQIGTSLGVEATDSLALDSVHNLIYKMAANQQLCTISAQASATTEWDCLTVRNKLPAGLILTTKNVASDTLGNIYTFATNSARTQYYLLKYDGITWSQQLISGLPAQFNTAHFNNIFIDGTSIYASTSLGMSHSRYINSLVAINPANGAYLNQIIIENLAQAVAGTNASISNGTLYLADGARVQAIELAKPTTITPLGALGATAAVAANATSLFACGSINVAKGSNIFQASLNQGSATAWKSIGYTLASKVKAGTYYRGCNQVTTSMNSDQVYVLGWTEDTTQSYAVYARPK
jgi:hypothetical protein